MNEYGLDSDYFKKSLTKLVENVDKHSPEEMYRALISLSQVCSMKTKKTISDVYEKWDKKECDLLTQSIWCRSKNMDLEAIMLSKLSEQASEIRRDLKHYKSV